MIYTIDEDGVDALHQGFALNVEMDKTNVYVEDPTVKSEAVILTTMGVGPCIAFLASGRYYLDADDKTGHYFAALRHYSGGKQSPITEEDLLQLGRDNLYDFFEETTLEIGDDEDTKIVLHQLCFIGGQEKDKNCCGTEKEVYALETALEQTDPFKTILPDNMTIDSALKPECRFFPSHGDAFVDIYVQREGDTSMKISLCYGLLDNSLLITDENRVDPVQPISPSKNFFSSSQSVHSSSNKNIVSALTPLSADKIYDNLGASSVEMHFFKDSPNRKRKAVSSSFHSCHENSNPEKRRTLLEAQRPGH
jgi:hypothetical protein